jgi:hypothetical protein
MTTTPTRPVISAVNKVDPSKLSGGAGAAEHMLNVAGNMNQQQTGADGSLAYKMPVVTGGVGLTEALVPAVLVLANTKLSKSWLRNSGLSGKTLKKGLSINGGSNELAKNGIEQHVGGNLANAIIVPTSLARVKNYMGNQINKTVKQTMNSRLLKRPRRSHSSKQNRKSKRRFRGKR